MPDSISRGLPFHLDQFWHTSLPLRAVDEDHGLFAPIDLELKYDSEFKDARPHFSFEVRALDDTLGSTIKQPEVLLNALDWIPSPALDTKPSAPCANRDEDVWSLDDTLSQPTPLPKFLSWETFGDQEVRLGNGPAYLSEAGPGAFDALLARTRSASDPPGVLPQDAALRALSNLILGRSSVFFQWDLTKAEFVQILEKAPLSGLSLKTSSGVIDRLKEYASGVRRLQEQVTGQSLRPQSAASRALQRCVVEILDAIEVSMLARLSSMRSLLQIQQAIERPRQLLHMLSGFVEAVEHTGGEEEAISKLADAVRNIAESGSSLAGVAHALLVRVSDPWLSSLRAELGLSASGKPLLGPLDDRSVHVDSALDADVSFEDGIPKTDDMSSVLSSVDRDIITETKQCLHILRQSAKQDDQGHSRPPLTTVMPTSLQELDPFAELCQFQNLEFAVLGSDQEVHSMPTDQVIGSASVNSTDALNTSVTRYLDLDDKCPSTLDNGDDAAFVEVDLLHTLRPLLHEQWHSVNDRLIRHLFGSCQLRRHLDLQQSFHLFGNGDFVERLSTALFSADTQSAERTRGQLPTAQTMGLRLGTAQRQRWPPASSELRLTLMDVLNECYAGQTADQKHMTGTSNNELPGNLSFAVRELTEAEIDRVIDAQSIYALDFIKLQYNAHAPLDAILTPAIMKRYDDIFRFLLRVLRLKDVARRLHSAGKHYPRHDSRTQLGVELAHAANALAMYATDTAIAPPWAAFIITVSEIESKVSGHQSGRHGSSVAQLRKGHEVCVDAIRGRLFLRRNQTKLRDALQDLLKTIMSSASMMLNSDEPLSTLQATSPFKSSLARLLDLLRDVADTPRKVSSTSEFDADVANSLLMRLDWNRYYCTGDTM